MREVLRVGIWKRSPDWRAWTPSRNFEIAYIFGSEGTMNAVFNKMPTLTMSTVFLFVAYDAVWKVVGQFADEMH